ncbi:uncharacterized protein [Rutidosis leptorrhynchoides]|uniref:uncharacterized protein n=1 Tax=Rutidosis leptorrhynchoides TaxID=125765 RepID=UPI003A98DFBA
MEDTRQEAENVILAIDSHQPYKKRERGRIIREWSEVSFPALDTICPSDLPVTINGRIFSREVRRIYLNSGSACDVMYGHFFDRLSPFIRARLGASRIPLVGFSEESCWPIGEIDLDFTIGEPPLTRTETIDFVVVRANSPHNILLGRVAMKKMGIIVSTVHQIVKFHTHEGIGTLASTYDRDKVILAIKETMKEPTECILEASKEDPQVEKISVNSMFPYQEISIGKNLPSSTKQKLRKLLQDNVDGSPFITEHRLNEHKHLEPVHQKKRNLALERDEAACKEVEGLLKAGIIREAKYPSWVANPVMVKKSDGGWRMCVDFTNINKACPKDCYP